jgi:phage terminase large subunit-like protein
MGNDYRIKVVSKTEDGGWTADRLPDGKCVPDVILIEAKSSGQSLLQSIRRLDFPKASVIGFNPTKYGDKVSRMRKVTHLVEGGMLYLPEKAGQPGVLRPHAKEFEDEISVFPQGTSKDVGDVFSMALTWMMERGLLSSELETISYVTESEEDAKVEREQAIY